MLDTGRDDCSPMAPSTDFPSVERLQIAACFLHGLDHTRLDMGRDLLLLRGYDASCEAAGVADAETVSWRGIKLPPFDTDPYRRLSDLLPTSLKLLHILHAEERFAHVIYAIDDLLVKRQLSLSRNCQTLAEPSLLLNLTHLAVFGPFVSCHRL